jgi:hypothetical protein
MIAVYQNTLRLGNEISKQYNSSMQIVYYRSDAIGHVLQHACCYHVLHHLPNDGLRHCMTTNSNVSLANSGQQSIHTKICLTYIILYRVHAEKRPPDIQ